MSYTDGMAGVLAQIAQVQSAFANPAGDGDGGSSDNGFDAVMQQISALTGTGSGGAGGYISSGGDVSGDGSPGASLDLSGSYGWPLEEGTLSPTQLAALGAPTVVDPPANGASTSGLNSSASQVLGAGLPSMAMSAGTASSGTTLTSAISGAGPSTTTGSSWGARVVADAQKYLGVPYQWGGTNPSTGVDCSGLVQNVFNDLGVSLPRTADEQSSVGTAVPSMSDAQPGDLIFFAGADGTATAPGHVGIYIGNGQMIDAPYTGVDVRVDQVSAAGTPVAIRRVSGPAVTSDDEALPTNAVDSDTMGTSTVADGTVQPAGSYSATFDQASASYGVPASLLSAVAETESSFNPDAVSTAGAKGLMQLMPATASSLGVNPLDPTQAINGAASLLSSYHEQFGSWSLALAAYNAGPNAVTQYGGIPPYAQTQSYVQNVLSRAGMEAQ